MPVPFENKVKTRLAIEMLIRRLYSPIYIGASALAFGMRPHMLLLCMYAVFSFSCNIVAYVTLARFAACSNFNK